MEYINSYQNYNVDFFRKNDEFRKIIKSISKDKTVKMAVKKFQGLRILRQDPFQCLISFIVSSNSNIPKIKYCLENISKKFGKKIKFQNQEFFLFPNPKKLAKVSINEITRLWCRISCKIYQRSSKNDSFKKKLILII